MEKKDKKISLICGVIAIAFMTFLICYFYIPRIDYNYDKKQECYYVNKAYLSLYKSSDDYHYLLIIDMPPLENMFIYSDIQMEVSKYSLLPIQVLIKDDNDLVDKVITNIKPFYEKVDNNNK